MDVSHPLVIKALTYAMGVGRLLVWLVLLVAIFVPLERLFSVRPAKIFRKQVWTDVGWYFINSLVPAIIIALPLALLARALSTINPFGLYSAIAAWPLWIKLLAAFFVNDIGVYWGHRATHHFKFLWRFHEVHHSAEHLDWLVNTRAHPFDMVFTRLCGLGPIYLLGLAGNSSSGAGGNFVPLVTIIGTVWSFFIHSNVKVRLGPFEYLISTPAFHHWHHTRDEMRDRNFAAIFPIIDYIFGTAWIPRRWPDAYGVSRKVSETLAGQFMDPIRKLFRLGKPEAKERTVVRTVSHAAHPTAESAER